MIFSFTGAQCTGKTTLLKHLYKENGDYPFVFIPEVTRLVKREYNMPINESYTPFIQTGMNARCSSCPPGWRCPSCSPQPLGRPSGERAVRAASIAMALLCVRGSARAASSACGRAT